MTKKRLIENEPNPEYIISRLKYNKEDGKLYWLDHLDLKKQKFRVGKVAGCISKCDGYVVLNILGKQYKAHILAYVIETGEWPTDQIDHINRIRSDNRWINLRISSNYKNSLNRTLTRSNNTGVEGVWYNKKINKYVARIRYNKGILKVIGNFSTLEEAKIAREEAKIKFHIT